MKLYNQLKSPRSIVIQERGITEKAYAEMSEVVTALMCKGGLFHHPQFTHLSRKTELPSSTEAILQSIEVGKEVVNKLVHLFKVNDGDFAKKLECLPSVLFTREGSQQAPYPEFFASTKGVFDILVDSNTSTTPVLHDFIKFVCIDCVELIRDGVSASTGMSGMNIQIIPTESLVHLKDAGFDPESALHCSIPLGTIAEGGAWVETGKYGWTLSLLAPFDRLPEDVVDDIRERISAAGPGKEFFNALVDSGLKYPDTLKYLTIPLPHGRTRPEPAEIERCIGRLIAVNGLIDFLREIMALVKSLITGDVLDYSLNDSITYQSVRSVDEVIECLKGLRGTAHTSIDSMLRTLEDVGMNADTDALKRSLLSNAVTSLREMQITLSSTVYAAWVVNVNQHISNTVDPRAPSKDHTSNGFSFEGADGIPPEVLDALSSAMSEGSVGDSMKLVAVKVSPGPDGKPVATQVLGQGGLSVSRASDEDSERDMEAPVSKTRRLH